jgi:threonylcarbamoyladenosine tRNA methylthiotransferase MtaB
MAGDTFKIYTLGCKVNQYDSGGLAARFKAAGLKAVSEDADLAVVNSCAVTRMAISKSRRAIARARKENPRARVVLAGCWAKIDHEIKEGEIKADKIVFEKNIDELSNMIMGRQAEDGVRAGECGMPGDWSRSRYFLKIQDGCEQFCTYCVIPYARGKLRNEPAEKVLFEMKQAVRSGYKEVVLCGIHLGLYQASNNKDLTELIKEILKIKDLGRVRLSSIELNEVSEELVSLMAKKRIPDRPYICRHLHIPLQSGCDKILKSMNRPYTSGQFAEKVRMIRKLIPEAAITSDVICGFPGETEEDFQATYDFIEKLEFSRLHVFSFSAHEKTPAAKMPGQIDHKIKQERAGKLRALGKRLEKDYSEKFKGMKLDVIAEHENKKGVVAGKTEYYFDVVLK